MIFVLMGFMAGVFATVFLTRILEVIHMWRMFHTVLTHMLIMCVSIIEEVSFLNQLKTKAMSEADFSSKQIKDFEEVWDKTLTNWQDSAILSIINRAPPRFRAMMPFSNWKEAVRFLEKALKE
jgi:hypothetical protein